MSAKTSKQNQKPKQSKQKNNPSMKSQLVVSAPVSRQTKVLSSKPRVRGNPNGRISVRHREFIADVSGSVNYSVVGYNINPGLTNCFVWLSNIASNFEKYDFKSLRFFYETQKSTATSGTLMMAMDFDAAEASPVNKPVLMSYQPATRSAVWAETCLHVDRKDLTRTNGYLFVRNGLLAANLDIKTYDVGKLYVATQGCADTSAIGELYVEYDVDLWIPQTQPQGGAVDDSLRFLLTTTQGVSINNLFGTGSSVIQGTTVFGGLNVGRGSGGLLTFFEIGGFLVHIIIVGTTLINGDPVLGGTIPASQRLQIQQFIATAGTTATYAILVDVTNPYQTLTIDCSALGATITQSVTRIASYAFSNG